MRNNKPAPVVSAMACAVLAAALAAPLAAHADGGTGSLQALTPLTIAPGGTVAFQFGFSKYQVLSETGAAEAEPAPAPGTQVWLQSSSQSFMETLSGFTLELSTSNQSVGLASVLLSGGEPGTVYSHTELASFQFDEPGSYTVSLSGTWQSLLSIGDFSIQGSRSCTEQAGLLTCTGWELIGVGGSALQDTSGQFGPVSLQVQVVPEPQTAALLLAGLGLVGAAARRRRG